MEDMQTLLIKAAATLHRAEKAIKLQHTKASQTLVIVKVTTLHTIVAIRLTRAHIKKIVRATTSMQVKAWTAHILVKF